MSCVSWVGMGMKGEKGVKSGYTVKIVFFPSPAGMSLTKLSLAGNNLIIPGQGEFD